MQRGAIVAPGHLASGHGPNGRGQGNKYHPQILTSAVHQRAGRRGGGQCRRELVHLFAQRMHHAWSCGSDGVVVRGGLSVYCRLALGPQ